MKRKIILFAIALAILPSGLNVLANNPTSAVTAADWKAGRIIDDSIFTKKDAMSVAEIQAFLNGKVGTGGNSGSVAGRCDTNGTSTSELGGGTRAQYGASHGNPAPFTCLKDYYEVPKTSPGPGIPANNYGGQSIPSGAKSAAELIWDAAQRYNISPRVLLVKLHTESAGPLTTDDWPLFKQYQYAMGAHCPDSGPDGSANCDENYAGFSIQISESAALLRYYLDNMTQSWWSYKKPYQNNNILWNVAPRNCGESTVYIENKATAALYTYTPYQPNQAALNNMYGLGDGCSAYGNRNFWRIFSDWYGGTIGADYSWSLNSQEVYTDSARTIPANTSILSGNTDYYFRVRALNTGNNNWTNSGSNPIRLGTVNPSNRISNLCNNTWGTCDRAATLIESSVAPGQVGTFEFKGSITALGLYKENFNLVAEGKEWFGDIGFYWQLNALAPTARWQAQTQNIYADTARTQPVNIDALSPNTTYYAKTTVRNIGNTVWSNTGSNPVRLGTNGPQDRSSPFYDVSWTAPNRAATPKETSVAPGTIGTFEFIIKTPATLGSYKEYFKPVVEGQAWMNDIGFYWPLTVAPPTPLWSVISQQTYTNSSKSTVFDSNQTPNASRVFVSVQVRNTGNTTWTNGGSNPVRLGTSSPFNRTSEFYDSTWISSNRPAVLKESSVTPGATGTFEFWVTAPYKTSGTTIKEYFQPVLEGITWFNDIGMYQPFSFSTPSNAWEYAGQSAYSNASRTTSIDLSSGLARNTTYYLQLRAKNISGVSWQQSTFSLGTSSPNDRASIFYDATSWVSTNRAARLKESSVAPGSTGTFEFTIKTPNYATTTNEYFRPLIEGVDWLTDIGLHWSIKVN